MYSNVQSLIGPLPEYYTFQSSVRDQHPGLRSACPFDQHLKKLTTILFISFQVTSGEVLEAYTKLVGTNADILNGRGTASPVSG